MNLVRASKIENIPCEQQAKLVHERILRTEENLGNICSALSFYAKKSARVRDASDEVATVFNAYAVSETVNKSLKTHLMEFSKILASIGDCRDVEVHQLESNLINQFCHYNTNCRNAKVEVKKMFCAKEKELNRRRSLAKTRSNGIHHREVVVKAELALSQAISHMSNVQRDLEEYIELFEKKKLQDLKSLLLEFVTIELTLHTRCVEELTKAYNELDQINVLVDLKDFHEVLKKKPMSLRLETVKKIPPRASDSESSTVSFGKVLDSTGNGLLRKNTDFSESQALDKTEEEDEASVESSEEETSSESSEDIEIKTHHSL